MPLTTNHTAHFLPLIASILVLCCACSDPPSSQDDTRDMDNIDMSIADSGADAPDTGADTDASMTQDAGADLDVARDMGIDAGEEQDSGTPPDDMVTMMDMGPDDAPTCQPSPPPTGVIYYVDVAGDDGAGDGSADSPWATITHALDNASDGSTILVRPGTYTGRIRMRGSFEQGVTVRSEVPYQARLRHDATVMTFYAHPSGCEGITLEGFDIAHSGPGAGALGQPAAVRAAAAARRVHLDVPDHGDHDDRRHGRHHVAR